MWSKRDNHYVTEMGCKGNVLNFDEVQFMDFI